MHPNRCKPHTSPPNKVMARRPPPSRLSRSFPYGFGPNLSRWDSLGGVEVRFVIGHHPNTRLEEALHDESSLHSDIMRLPVQVGNIKC